MRRLAWGKRRSQPGPSADFLPVYLQGFPLGFRRLRAACALSSADLWFLLVKWLCRASIRHFATLRKMGAVEPLTGLGVGQWRCTWRPLRHSGPLRWSPKQVDNLAKHRVEVSDSPCRIGIIYGVFSRWHYAPRPCG